MPTNNYGGFVWTNHALDRLIKRGIKQGDAIFTLKHPDNSRYAKSKEAWVYSKTLNGNKISVVAKQNEKKEWVVLSVWDKKSEHSGYENKSLFSLLINFLRKK